MIPESEENWVDWEGPSDPDLPSQWPHFTKLGILGAVCTMRFTVTFASFMMSSSLLQIHDEFGGSRTLISFTVSVYVVGLGVGPLIFAPLSESFGRSKIYHVGNVLFTIFTVACALAPNAVCLLVFRLFAGLAGGVPVTNAGGTIADLLPVHKRGLGMSVFTMVLVLAPVIGPVIGGFLAASAGWRWVFWLLAILSGVTMIVSCVTLRETYTPVLLERKAAKLRQETRNPNLRARGSTGEKLGHVVREAVTQPFRMLCTNPIVLGLSFYVGLLYGISNLFFTILTDLFYNVYGWSHQATSLSFLGIGAGCLVALLLTGALGDRIYLYLTERHGEGKPMFRLAFNMPATIIFPVGILVVGWPAQYHVHWIVPIAGTALIGMGSSITTVCIQTYLVDAFRFQEASALAANNLLRCILGGLLPLAGPATYHGLGLGWGCTVLSLVALLCGLPSIAFYFYYERDGRSGDSVVHVAQDN